MRFSLATLVLIVTVVALTLATISQYKQSYRIQLLSNQIHELSARLEEFKDYGEIQDRISSFVATLNLDNKDDLQTFRLVRQCVPKAPAPGEVVLDESWRHAFQQLIDVYPGESGLQVLSLKYRDTGGGPYSGPNPREYSVNVLFSGPEVVEVLILGFDVEFLDYNDDGIVDLTVRKQVMFEKEVIRYGITWSGFTQVVDDETAE